MTNPGTTWAGTKCMIRPAGYMDRFQSPSLLEDDEGEEKGLFLHSSL